ncbi:MAG: hypothetical protein WAQ52_17055 [Terriglobales bacterium]
MKSGLVYATLAAVVLGLTLSASARDVVLPAGTLLQCTLNEPNFSSATAAVGDPVLCHLRGLTEFGQQAFPRGSYLVGHLESAKDPGHFFGKGNMKLQFDRIGLPSGDLPLDAKVIATRGYRVDREGDIKGKGHAKRDVIEWMLPPLWPWKVLMLPARGPRPTLKGESVMTLRLMDDVQVPQVAQGSAPLGPGWHYFGEPRSESFHGSQFQQTTPQLAVHEVTPTSDEEPATVPRASYASFVTKEVPLPAPRGAASSEAQSVAATRPSVGAPGTPIFVLKSGMVLEVGNFTYREGRITYTLASGGNGVISTDEVDWSTTTRVNSEHGVRVTLRSGHQYQGAPGL